MQPLLNIDIERMSIAERIQLVEDLWDSIVAHPETLPVTATQQQALDRRLEKYRQNPEAGSSWQAVKARILKSQ